MRNTDRRLHGRMHGESLPYERRRGGVRERAGQGRRQAGGLRWSGESRLLQQRATHARHALVPAELGLRIEGMRLGVSGVMHASESNP